MLARRRVAPTEGGHLIKLLARTPELIRPVVLFGQSPAEHAVETSTAERTLYRQVAGQPDKSRAPHRPATKVTLRAITIVKELDETR